MRALGERIERLDASLVLIGNGTVEQACEYKLRASLPFRLLVDPKLVGYQAMALKRSLRTGFRPRKFFGLARAWRTGLPGGPVGGDDDQLGGLFVIDRDGEVRYAHVSHEPGDEPPVEELLESLRRIQAVGRAEVMARPPARRREKPVGGGRLLTAETAEELDGHAT